MGNIDLSVDFVDLSVPLEGLIPLNLDVAGKHVFAQKERNVLGPLEEEQLVYC